MASPPSGSTRGQQRRGGGEEVGHDDDAGPPEHGQRPGGDRHRGEGHDDLGPDRGGEVVLEDAGLAGDEERVALERRTRPAAAGCRRWPTTDAAAASVIGPAADDADPLAVERAERTEGGRHGALAGGGLVERDGAVVRARGGRTGRRPGCRRPGRAASGRSRRAGATSSRNAASAASRSSGLALSPADPPPICEPEAGGRVGGGPGEQLGAVAEHLGRLPHDADGRRVAEVEGDEPVGALELQDLHRRTVSTPTPRRTSCSSGASMERSASTRRSVISLSAPPPAWLRNSPAGRLLAVVEDVAVEPAHAPERDVVARVERLADHRHVGAGRAVEPGAVVGPGHPVAGQRADRHRRPAVREHRQRPVAPRPGPWRTCGWRRRRGPPDPTRRTAPTRARTVAVPSSSGTSDRPWVRCSGVTPNTSHSVACRSTVVVSAPLVPGATPGHEIEQRDVAELGVHGDLRLAPEPALAEVVAVVGAEDERGGVPRVVAVDHVEDAAEPVVDHRELGAVLAAQVDALPLGEARLLLAPRVRRPDEPLALPVGVVAARPRLRGVERLVRVELVDDEQRALVGGRVRRTARRRARRRRPPSSSARGSRPRP